MNTQPEALLENNLIKQLVGSGYNNTNHTQSQIEKSKEFKKGLLQGMFV